MFIAKLLFFLLLVSIKNSAICNAKKIAIPKCDQESPSCGNIHNISYPFWLEGQPEECGEPKYKLLCDNSNKTVMYLDSVKYFVQSINRENFTLRLVDAFVQKDNCSSVPLNLVTYDSGNYRIIFLSCETPLSNSSLFVDTKPCMSGKKLGKNYSYATFGQNAKISDLQEKCSIDLATMSAKPITCGLNCSYSEIHDLIAYGFELSWRFFPCEKFCQAQGTARFCSMEDGGNINYHCNTRCDFKCLVTENVYRGLYYIPFYGIVPMLMLRFVIGVLIFFALLIYKWRRRHLSLYDAVEEFLQSQNNLRPIKYSFSDLKNMTKAFKDKLGEGGYGSVYKGTLRSGRDVAVKVLGKSKANGQEFINEVATIGRIHHINVVRLIGFCAESSKRSLVYEFMPNGSLDKHIFPREGKVPLSYEKMFEISLGVARGIEYLHRGCDMRILHFDIKPHNILLDENFVPKVSDFGLAKLYPVDGSIGSLTAIRGTIGYIAPELFYKSIGSVSYKADVYSFGMLLLEMTGKRRVINTNPESSSENYFPSWVYNQISEGKSLEIEDAAEDEVKLVRKMDIIGLWCIQMRPNDRPSMNRVIEMLESEIEFLEMPPKPSLYVEDVTVKLVENQTCSSTLSGGDSMESSSLISNAN